jgi:hypothetical protein
MNDMNDEKRQAVLQTLSAKFGLPLLRVLKFSGDDPKYRLETTVGPVDLGDVRGLIGQAKLRERVAARTGIYLPLFKKTVWPKYAKNLLSLCEEVDRGSDATMEGTLREWLAGYLDQHPPHASLKEADEGREPFLDGGAVHIFTSGFRRWLTAQQDERISRNDLTADLRAFGAEPVKFDLDIEGKTTSRSAWKLPDKAWPVP